LLDPFAKVFGIDGLGQVGGKPERERALNIFGQA
jgi:hypothetical protein